MKQTNRNVTLHLYPAGRRLRPQDSQLWYYCHLLAIELYLNFLTTWGTIPSFAKLSVYTSLTLSHLALALTLGRSGSGHAWHCAKSLMNSTPLPSSATGVSHDRLSGAVILDMYYLPAMCDVEEGDVLQGSESRSAVLVIQVGKW